jgi:hypothetical protein
MAALFDFANLRPSTAYTLPAYEIRVTSACTHEWALRWQQIVTQTNGSPVTPFWQTREITWQPLSLAGYGVTTTYGLQTSTIGTGLYQGVIYTDAIPGLWVSVVEVKTMQGP